MSLANISTLVSDQRTMGRSSVRGHGQQTSKGDEIMYFNF